MSRLYLYRGGRESGFTLEESFPTIESIKEYVHFYPEVDFWLVKVSRNGKVLNAAYADRNPDSSRLLWREYGPLREHFSP